MRGLAAALFLLLSPAFAQDAARSWRPLGPEEGLASVDVYDLCAAGDDRVWAATAAGVCLVEADEITLVSPERARRLAAGPDGTVYALAGDRILHLTENGVETPIPLPGPAADDLRSDATGTLWLVAGEATYRRAPDGPWEQPAAPDPPADVGLPAAERPAGSHRAIRFRMEIWAATKDRGILRQRLVPRFRPFALPGIKRINALAAAPDGTIWCGTERGLASIDPDGGVALFPDVNGRPFGVVTTVAVDRDGRVWAGSGSAFTGVYRYDGAAWSKLDAIDGHVHRITLDSSGALWFAALNAAGGGREEGRGAWTFSDGAFKPALVNLELPSERVYDVVARDPSGVLWFATLKGLAAYEGPNRVTRYTRETGLAGDKVWTLCAGSGGSLWIGYQEEHGVSRLSGGRVLNYGVADGLCDGNVWAIAEGRRGVFWFATESGVSRFDGLRWSCFRDEEGLGTAPIWPVLPLPDGSLWIGTLGAGLVRCEPDDRVAPRTRFAGDWITARANEERTITWSGSDHWFDTPRKDLWYRWRLDEGRWSEASTATSVTLTLEPGRYRFRVQAIDRFGNAEDPPAGIEIHAQSGLAAFDVTFLYWGAFVLLACGFAIGLLVRRKRS